MHVTVVRAPYTQSVKCIVVRTRKTHKHVQPAHQSFDMATTVLYGLVLCSNMQIMQQFCLFTAWHTRQRRQNKPVRAPRRAQPCCRSDPAVPDTDQQGAAQGAAMRWSGPAVPIGQRGRRVKRHLSYARQPTGAGGACSGL